MNRLAIMILVMGCATVPVRQDTPRIYHYEASPDEVWGALTEVVREMELPVETAEREAGLLTTDWFGVESDEESIDCGTRPPGPLGYFSARIQARATEEAHGVRLEITAAFQGLLSDLAAERTYTLRCFSTGKWESLISGMVEERMGTAGPYRKR